MRIFQQIGPALAEGRRIGFAVESSAHAFHIVGKEERRACDRFEQYRVMDRPAGCLRIEFFGTQMKPALRGRRQRRGFVRLVVPSLAVEFGQRDSAPVHAARRIEASIDADAHDHHRCSS